jgi:hypothetical protein
MTRKFTIVFQIIGMLIQGYNVYGGLIPPKYQGVVAAAVGLLQAIQGVAAHSFNVDGTPQTMAFKVAPPLPGSPPATPPPGGWPPVAPPARGSK